MFKKDQPSKKECYFHKHKTPLKYKPRLEEKKYIYPFMGSNSFT